MANFSNKSALIEGDDIYHQVVGGYVQPWKNGNHLDTFWRVCIDMIKTYLMDGFDVVFNYIITPKNLSLLRSEFIDYTIKFVVLLADETTLLFRDEERTLDCQMKERCVSLLHDFENENYDIKNILDTSNLSVADILRIIRDDIRFIL